MTYNERRERLNKTRLALTAIEAAMDAAWSAQNALPDTSEGREVKPSLDKAWEHLRGAQKQMVVVVYDQQRDLDARTLAEKGPSA